VIFLALLSPPPQASVAAESEASIRFAGVPAELALSEVSERTVRLELSPLDDRGNPRPPSPSTVLVPFVASEKLRVRELPREKELRVGELRVIIKSQPLIVSVRRADGKLVQELAFDEMAATNAGVAFHTDGPVLGLGEGAQQFDRRGALYPMEPGWGAWNRPVLGSVVPSPFVIGTEGWAVLAHRPEGQFDLRESKGRFIPWQDPQGSASLDLFVISVQNPADALTEYTRLTGRPVMPPKWALGYFQSHRTLAGPEEPLQVARTFREKQLPCDALIYLGTGYCTNGWNTGHGSLAFNTNAFAPENIKSLHNQNFKVVFHVNHAPRNLFGTSIALPEERKPTPNPSQEGSRRSDARRQVPSREGSGVGRFIESNGVRGLPEDFDSPRHIRNYWARHRNIFALGVDGWWPDDGDELPLEARLTRHRCYYEGPLQDRPNIRPWSLHRTGYAGSQRYGGWIWSGDIDGRWETLAAHVSVGLNHGLSLTPFWGSDTGGFYPTRELTGELYARWFQFSAFCPSFRSHGRTWHLRLPWGWNTGEYGPIENNQNVNRAELHNAEVEPICRKYLELRYRLLPYNYALAREACDTGLPMMRALWLHYPDDAEAVKLGSEYLWGRDLLVAPVVEKGLKSRRVYLPAGIWYDWWTGEKVQGKRWIDRSVDLATLPLYVRAGAIIPLDPVRQYTSQPVSEPTVLRVYPGANGTFTLYDDDGQSLGYRDGSDPKMTWIRCRWDDGGRRLALEPDGRMKRWPGGVRVFSVEVVGSDAQLKRVEFRGGRVVANL
jgi:alpha-glucosidase/alpha-D-xyloside xylohydrolase